MATTSKSTIATIHELPGAGGSHICRILSAIPSVMLFSEVNPRSQHIYDLGQQLRDWHKFNGDLDQACIEGDKNERFKLLVSLCVQHSVQRNMVAVFRDWSFADFIATPYVDCVTNVLSLLRTIPEGCDVKSIALVRHPVDQAVIMAGQIESLGVSLEAISKGILSFAKEVVHLDYLKVEEFQNNSQGFIADCCRKLGLEFDGECLNRWVYVKNITGNAVLDRESLGQCRILSPRTLSRLTDLPSLREACDLLGYKKPFWMLSTQRHSKNRDASERSFEMLLNEGLFDEAIIEIRNIEKTRPLNVAELGNLAVCLLNVGVVYEAAEILRHLLSREEQLEPILRLLADCYLKMKDEENELLYRRELDSVACNDGSNLYRLMHLTSKSGDTKESIQYARRILLMFPNDVSVRSSYLMNLLYCDGVEPTEISSEHFRLGMRNRRTYADRLVTGSKPDRPRVGFLSKDFGEHPVGKISIPIIAQLAKHGIQTYAFHDSDRFDSRTANLKSSVSKFCDVCNLSNADLAQRLASEELDVLVDLGGFTAGGTRLEVFGSQIAKVQASYLGYPFSSALDTIHYRITDSLVDPVGFVEHLYSERLARMPHGHFAWEPYLESDVIPTTRLDKEPLLGCFNNPAKISLTAIQCFARILQCLPNCKLLFRYGDRYESRSARSRVRAIFAQERIAPERVIFFGKPLPLNEHLENIASVDVALDPFPYQGTMTTLDCLSVGTPVVSLLGEFYVQRATSAMFLRNGFDELVAQDVDEYIQIVVSLVQNRERLPAIRKSLKESYRSGSMSDVGSFASNLAELFRSWI